MRLTLNVACVRRLYPRLREPGCRHLDTPGLVDQRGHLVLDLRSGTGTTMFIDILDNRNPGSTTDDAERWTVGFIDDFTGWQLLEFPFASFTRKEIGNGAPNDGLGLFEMHGYAIGTLSTGGPQTYYFDEVEHLWCCRAADPDRAILGPGVLDRGRHHR